MTPQLFRDTKRALIEAGVRDHFQRTGELNQRLPGLDEHVDRHVFNAASTLDYLQPSEAASVVMCLLLDLLDVGHETEPDELTSVQTDALTVAKGI